MHLGTPALLDFYHQHREQESLVLATIIGTEGSTYRKPGAMMLISNDGSFEGMISGGCLEGDLLQHANSVFADGGTRFVTYDMHAGDDMVWGLGIGCDGIIKLMLQRLDRKDEFGFLEQLSVSHSAGDGAIVALAVGSHGAISEGSFAYYDHDGASLGDPVLLERLTGIADNWPDWRFRKTVVGEDQDSTEALLIHMPVQIRVLICGAGPDAVPVARVLAELDWDVHIVDHRPAFARPERFPAKCSVIQARPEKLGESVDLAEIDAAVIMSHHLENDSMYLQQLAQTTMPYLGVLGPSARRDRLREMSGCENRPVYGPVGLDIGAELPASIALSIAAEIHAVLNQRDGTPLTPRAIRNE